MSYIGLDIGITGTKAIVLSGDGRILAKSYSDYGEDYKKDLKLRGEEDPSIF